MEILGLTLYLFLGSVICLLFLLGSFKLLERYGDNIFSLVEVVRKKKETALVTTAPRDSTITFSNVELINTRQLGDIEGSLISLGLEQVIIMADKIERPSTSLLNAVLKNFEKGVEYVFLISAHNAEHEMTRYHQVFSDLAKAAIDKTERFAQPDDLFKIYKLPYNLNDCPYIFYRVKESDDESGLTTIALRGLDATRGIANNYAFVPPEFARTIARAVLTDAPVQMKNQPASERILMNDTFQEVPEILNDLNITNWSN